MFANWIKERFKDDESARTTIAVTAIVGSTICFLVFITAMMLAR